MTQAATDLGTVTPAAGDTPGAPNGGGAAPGAGTVQPSGTVAPTGALVSLDGWPGQYDGETAQYIQGKGWKGPEHVVKAFRSFEAHVRSPAERLLRLPEKEDDPQAWSEIYGKLGRPASPDKYDLGEPPKPGEGEIDLTPGFRTKAHEFGLTQRQARGILDWYNAEANQAGEAYQTSARAAIDQKIGADYIELQKKQGAQWEAYLQSARSGVQASGISTEERDTMLATLGVEKTYGLLAKLGSAMAEHQIGDQGVRGGGTGSLTGTPEWAQKRIADMGPAYVKKYSEKTLTPAEVKEWNDLHQMAYPTRA